MGMFQIDRAKTSLTRVLSTISKATYHRINTEVETALVLKRAKLLFSTPTANNQAVKTEISSL